MNNELNDAQRDALLQIYAQRVMALEVMVRGLLKAHPNPGDLVEAVRHFETGLDRSLHGKLPQAAREQIQSCLDQAGLG